MTVRQLADWMRRYITWGAEMQADRRTIRDFTREITAENKGKHKE